MLQLTGAQKTYKRQAVKPINVALGIAAGAISSHFSSVLMIWRSQTAKYAKITAFMAKQTKPKLNGILKNQPKKSERNDSRSYKLKTLQQPNKDVDKLDPSFKIKTRANLFKEF
jgi:hypothetical protein